MKLRGPCWIALPAITSMPSLTIFRISSVMWYLAIAVTTDGAQ